MVDKYRAKQWVADKIGDQYVIPTLAVYDSVDEIDLDKLPNRFVLKCNHDCGSVVICNDKSMFDLEAAKKKLGDALKKNYYWNSREWPYKNVKRCVFAEKYLETTASDEERGNALADYKFYTFNGEPKLFYITSNRGKDGGLKEDFFDLEGNLMNLNQQGYEGNQNTPKMPENLNFMVDFARDLAKDTYHIRVDFYEVNNRLYVGELTFYDGAGFCGFTPDKYNRILGDWIKLPTDCS